MLSDGARERLITFVVQELGLVPCDMPLLPAVAPTSSWILADPAAATSPVIGVFLTVLDAGLEGDAVPPGSQLPAWLRAPLVLITARFQNNECDTVQVRMDSLEPIASTTPIGSDAEKELKKRLEVWRGKCCPTSGRESSSDASQQQHEQQQQHARPSFGIPQAFASRGGGVVSASPPILSNPYGQSDLVPSGGNGGFSRQGGSPAPFSGGGVNGGMMLGPHNPMFGASPSFAGGTDPASGLARYDPIMPTAGPRFGGGGPPRFPPGNGMPGEPDPDHLRPWNNDELDPHGLRQPGWPRGGGRTQPHYRGGGAPFM